MAYTAATRPFMLSKQQHIFETAHPTLVCVTSVHPSQNNFAPVLVLLINSGSTRCLVAASNEQELNTVWYGCTFMVLLTRLTLILAQGRHAFSLIAVIGTSVVFRPHRHFCRIRNCAHCSRQAHVLTLPPLTTLLMSALFSHSLL